MIKKKVNKRFIDNKDGTITDKSTALTWVKDPSQLGGVFGTSGNPSRMNYSNAVKACKKLKYAGHDWRLPTIKELISIIDHEKYDPAIDTKFFVSKSSWYWSSTNRIYWSGSAWIVNFSGGDVSDGGKVDDDYVRPVRASQ